MAAGLLTASSAASCSSEERDHLAAKSTWQLLLYNFCQVLWYSAGLLIIVARSLGTLLVYL